MIYAIDHVQIAIPVGQEEQARQFYVAVLGMTEIPKPTALTGRGGLWLSAGSAQLHLGVGADFRPAGKAHPAFLVRDLAASLAVCRVHGCEVKDDEPPLDGYLRAHVFDPFGNRIELMQVITNSSSSSQTAQSQATAQTARQSDTRRSAGDTSQRT